MLNSDEDAMALADQFYAAAAGAGSWYDALHALATATGGRSGELIAVGPDAALPIHVMTNIDPDLLVDSMVQRIGDPHVNPRIRAGMESRVLAVMAENDFLTPEEHKVHPHYQAFARPWDIPFICCATLDRRKDLMVGLAVLRSQKQGHVNERERRVFGAIAPHVRAAVRMQFALEEQGAALLNGLFESLSLPAFLCDQTGRVQSMTPAAEAIVADGQILQLKGGQLTAVDNAGGKALADAIDAAAQDRDLAARAPRSVIVRSPIPTRTPLVLDVIPLPASALDFSLTTRILVMPQSPAGGDARRRLLLQGVYKLTSAETDVAMRLLQGAAAEAIAAAREVAVATIRAQIKSILAKFGVTRQIELVARIAQL
jgi:DNA-binding CsgD family transcriptional regulator